MLTDSRNTPKDEPIRSSILTIFCERIRFDIALLTVIATLCIAVKCSLSTPIRKGWLTICEPVALNDFFEIKGH